jgi:hypothetical protein
MRDKLPDFMLDDGPRDHRGVSFFDMVSLLLLITPLVLLTGESLLSPLFVWVQSIFSNDANLAASVDALPLDFYIKLGLFIALCFFGGVQLILRLNTVYYGTWSLWFNTAHPLHTPYRPDPQISPLALLQWTGYRLLHILVPPVFMLAVIFGLGALELYLFNLMSALPGLPLQLIVGTFLFLMCVILSVFVGVRSLWVLLYSLFGDVIAITEPHLTMGTILSRCRRIALISPGLVLLYMAYILFGLALLVTLVWLLWTYDIDDMLRLKVDFLQLLGIECLLLGLYLLLNYWNLSAYHHAVVTYYNRLPAPIKDRLQRVL